MFSGFAISFIFLFVFCQDIEFIKLPRGVFTVYLFIDLFSHKILITYAGDLCTLSGCLLGCLIRHIVVWYITVYSTTILDIAHHLWFLKCHRVSKIFSRLDLEREEGEIGGNMLYSFLDVLLETFSLLFDLKTDTYLVSEALWQI